MHDQYRLSVNLGSNCLQIVLSTLVSWWMSPAVFVTATQEELVGINLVKNFASSFTFIF